MNKFKQNFNLLILVTILIIMGIFFRFVNIGEKIFWVDEVATAVRVSGYTKQEIVKELENQDISPISQLKQYQKLNAHKTFKDSWHTFQKSPEHSPLYFLLTRLWLSLWGDSITVMRSLSAFFSLLILPCIYYFSKELFKKNQVSLLSLMLMTVSPFYVAYGQEARPYSLWTITILLSCLFLLKAIRINKWKYWVLYSISLILSFYTSLLSLFVSFSHTIYFFLQAKNSSYQLIKRYLISLTFSLLLFTPWLWIIFNNWHLIEDNTKWMRIPLEIPAIVGIWIASILITFGDLPLVSDLNPLKVLMILMAVIIIFILLTLIYFNQDKFKGNNLLKHPSKYYYFVFILLLIISLNKTEFFQHLLNPLLIIGVTSAFFILILSLYSTFFVIKQCPMNQWLLLVCLMLSTIVPLIIIDLINQGQSSATPRYLIPLQLAVQLAVSYTIAINLEPINITFRNSHYIWRFVAFTVITLGLISCLLNINKSPIYQKGRNLQNINIANIINQKKSSLILTESQYINDLLSLSHNLSPDTQFKIINLQDNFLDYLNTYPYIFIFNPSSELNNFLQEIPTIKYQKVYQPQLLTPSEISLKLWLISKLDPKVNSFE